MGIISFAWGFCGSAAVVEGGGRVLAVRGPFHVPQQRPQTAPGGGEGGQQTENAQYRHDPQAQTEFFLEPDGDHQEKAGGEEDREAKLRDPYEQ